MGENPHFCLGMPKMGVVFDLSCWFEGFCEFVVWAGIVWGRVFSNNSQFSQYYARIIPAFRPNFWNSILP